ncbi:hypothetical protein PIB30_014814 [Stylosanthes scabra]|uniref:Uncharacterized protein n=1 Tax=Stylosanthes scabra TaxID=79078 RepID=A0ABU6Q6R1_9FABA|nr:hypothetical protein [Stylosanthes scabra]
MEVEIAEIMEGAMEPADVTTREIPRPIQGHRLPPQQSNNTTTECIQGMENTADNLQRVTTKLQETTPTTLKDEIKASLLAVLNPNNRTTLKFNYQQWGTGSR